MGTHKVTIKSGKVAMGTHKVTIKSGKVEHPSLQWLMVNEMDSDKCNLALVGQGKPHSRSKKPLRERTELGMKGLPWPTSYSTLVQTRHMAALTNTH